VSEGATATVAMAGDTATGARILVVLAEFNAEREREEEGWLCEPQRGVIDDDGWWLTTTMARRITATQLGQARSRSRSSAGRGAEPGISHAQTQNPSSNSDPNQFI